MSVHILFVGDIHLGLQATRIPGVLENEGLTVHELGPAAAWRATVDWARRHSVDAVALAGDVCDSDNARHEAYFELKRGMEKLTQAGIPVFAVAGNHDTTTLPRLIGDLDGVELLGPGGTWSAATVTGSSGGTVDLVGWSFPESRFDNNPLATALPPRPDDRPVLGLLHCNLDGDRKYAPVRSADLLAAPVDQWLLGHIHKPSLAAGSDRPGYLGSLTGLDPSETGKRGPWLLEVRDDGSLTREHLPLAPLRWEVVTIELDAAVFDGADFDARLRTAMLDLAHDLGPELDETRALGCRLRLTGRCGDPAALGRALADFRDQRVIVPHENLFIFLDRTVVNDVRPMLDLDRLARGTDPPALLARQLLALENFDELGHVLVSEAKPELEKSVATHHYSGLQPPTLDDAEICRVLILAGRRALAGMLAQKGGPG